MIPLAPFPIALIIKLGVTLPVQLILIGLMVAGYCARMVPAISPAPYPHFQHMNAIIFTWSFAVIYLVPLYISSKIASICFSYWGSR